MHHDDDVVPPPFLCRGRSVVYPPGARHIRGRFYIIPAVSPTSCRSTPDKRIDNERQLRERGSRLFAKRHNALTIGTILPSLSLSFSAFRLLRGSLFIYTTGRFSFSDTTSATFSPSFSERRAPNGSRNVCEPVDANGRRRLHGSPGRPTTDQWTFSHCPLPIRRPRRRRRR